MQDQNQVKTAAPADFPRGRLARTAIRSFTERWGQSTSQHLIFETFGGATIAIGCFGQAHSLMPNCGHA